MATADRFGSRAGLVARSGPIVGCEQVDPSAIAESSGLAEDCFSQHIFTWNTGILLHCSSGNIFT